MKIQPISENPNHSSPLLVAIYWDFENLRIPRRQVPWLKDLPQWLKDLAQSRGCLVSRKVYSHWQPTTEKYKHILENRDFEVIDVKEKGKNSVDRQLESECRQEFNSDLAPDILILVSGDKKYIPLVRDLQGLGKQVIIVGPLRRTNYELISLAEVGFWVSNGGIIPLSEIVASNFA